MMFARDQGQGVCAEVFWLPGPEQRCICGLREGRVLDALISGGGLDACEELPTGSWVRDSLTVGDFIYPGARLRPGQMLGSLCLL